VIALAAVAVLATVVAVGITFTPVFGARAILVRGNEALEADRVVRLAGLEMGVNVAHLDVVAAETRLRRDPWVAAASIRRDLPGTIVIEIQERHPMAAVRGGPVLAGDGTVLPGAEPERLPEIVPSFGELDPIAATGAAEALAAMRASLRRLVAAVVVEPDRSLAIHLRTGVRVDYGVPDDLWAKGASLRAVLDWADREGSALTRVDVTVSSAPTAILVGAVIPAPLPESHPGTKERPRGQQQGQRQGQQQDQPAVPSD
jgi:cell division protein FtsQ